MNTRKVAAFLLAVCGAVAYVPALCASDPRQSHLPLPKGAESSLDENDLAARLRPTQDMGAFRSLLEKMLQNPEKFSNLSNQQKKMLGKLLQDPDTQKLLKDPKMQELVRDAMKNPNLSQKQLDELRKQADQVPPDVLKKLAEDAKTRPDDFNLKPEDIEAVRKRAEDSKKPLSPDELNRLTEILKKVVQNPNLSPENADAVQRILPDLTPSTDPAPAIQPDPPPNMGQPDNRPTGLSPPVAPDKKAEEKTPGPDVNDLATDLLLKGADWLHDSDPDNERLDHLSEWMRDVAKGNVDDKWLQDVVEKSPDWLGSLRLGDYLPSDETRQTASSLLDNFSTPSLPKMGSGSSSTGTGSFSSSGSTFPTGGSGPSLDTEQLARFFAWTVALAVAGFAAWYLLMLYRGADGQRHGIPRRWPVAPGKVATRGDLVRAFEYLALLLLGVDARHRHHLDLAQRLGGSAPQSSAARQSAANELAHLYELARYAPEDEPLPEADLALARRDLTLLAGAGAA